MSEAHKVNVFVLAALPCTPCNIHLTLTGLAVVQRAFDAKAVELLPGGPPRLLQEGKWQGYTEKLFKAGCIAPVIVAQNSSGLARELCDNEGAPNAIIKNNDVARHMQHPSSMVEPKDFKLFATTEEGLTAVLKDAYNDRSRPRHQWTGAMLPPCAFDERNMKVAMPGWCNPCKQDYTVKDLIHYAVDSIGFATLLNAHEGHLEALTRLYVNIIVKSAILITISLLKLEREQLALVSDANVVGRTAKGSVDYLLKVGGLQGGVVITVVNGWRVLTPEYQGQVLAQMSALIDSAEATTNDACAIPGRPSLKRKRDVFGIVTNGNEWAIYRFQSGSPDVCFEGHGLSFFMGPKHEGFANEIQKLLSSLVGVFSYQVRARLPGSAVTAAKRKGGAATCMEGRRDSAGRLQDYNASKRAKWATSSNTD